MIKRPLIALAVLSVAASAALAEEQDLHAAPESMRGSTGENVPAFAVRRGYRVELAADDLAEARFMVFGDNGTLYLSQPREEKVVALRDENDDGVFEKKTDFVTDQSNVHSMDFVDGWLWYTSSADGALRKARDTNGDGEADEVQTVIDPSRSESDGIPAGGGHAFRGVLVEPDQEGGGRVLITVSDPQNMTSELDTDRKTVFAFDLDGSNRRVFAKGIRNTEKLRHRIAADGSETDEVWGADHGSDNFGRAYGDNRESQPITDLNPPDELNHLEEGKFYGHPYLMADRTPRPEYVDRDDLHELAAKTVPAAWSYVAHSATNGFCFAGPKAAELFGDESMTGDLFQAQHGSWNRSTPVGYSVNRVLFDEMTGRPYGELKIVDCHDSEGRPEARPVDCVEAPDGSILFTCDSTQRIYRIVPDDAK